MSKISRARANSNIALIKYWGKEDENLIIPMNSSLSMTLDCFYTETEVYFDRNLEEDSFYLDGKRQKGRSLERVVSFIDLFREKSKVKDRVVVKSINHVPTAAGLASSASGFAALGGALNDLMGLNFDARTLSTYIRQGSGSASRSVFGGFVQWNKGESSSTSYAEKIDDGIWDIAMVIVVVNNRKKEISSTLGMERTVKTSPFYSGWVENASLDIEDIKIAIKNKDIDQVGEIAERNALMMHGTMLGAKPPILYWQKETVEVMEIVKELRKEGLSCYYTMDAGPNVKILCRKSEQKIIEERLQKSFDKDKIILSGIGKGLTLF